MRKLGLIAILLAASSAALAQPKPPNLSVVTEGTHLEVYWNPVIDADGYTLYYAPYPAADPIFRLNLDPAVTSLSGTLSAGDAFYLALTASSSGVESTISNIEIFTLSALGPEDANASQADVIANVARTVIVGTYADLADKTTELFEDVAALNLSSSEDNLVEAQQAWRRASSAWEQSEAFLFGPVETMGIEPMLDSWPVDLSGIDTVLTGGDSLTSGFVSNLDGALKGFHTIEFLLFGEENDKVAADLTAREKEYLAAATENLASTARTLSDAWAAGAGNHVAEFLNIDGSGIYLNEAGALQELIRGMSAIAVKASNIKISDPFSASNAELVESQFSFNTLMDLADNIRGIENIYIGRYLDQDGPGLNDLVRRDNPDLDDRIRAAISSAIAGIRGISFPFRDAVLAPGAAAQIEAAIAAVAELQVLLDSEVQGHLTGGGDSQPSFGVVMVADQDYEVSTAISPLTLPAASDGDGALTYSLSPDVPGLSFNATTRQLTGTPTMEGSYAMTYTVMDDDGDADSISFSITAGPPDDAAEGFAPADQASFDVLAVGKRATTGDSRYYTDFTSPGRFSEVEDSATYTGSYTYERTGPNMGRIVFSYDDGDSCTSTFTFDSATSGSSTFTCNDGSTGTSSWELVESSTAAVTIPDADLRAVIEAALSKASGAPVTVADIETLTNLFAQEAAISDLTGLESASNLTRLFLDVNNITDLSPISGLANLTQLDLSANNITDLSPISGLANLTQLDLSANNITDLSPISGLANLRELTLSANSIRDISALSGLTDLTRLEIWGNQIEDISVLSGLTNLEMLSIGQNNVTDISALSGLTNLRDLGVGDANIQDISPLAGLTNLTSLSVLAANIQDEDVSLLSGLTNLRRLGLSHNRITDISALAELTGLTWLWLWDNQIEDISALAGLTNLTFLSLGKNNITDISALANFSNLETLFLNENNITDLLPLSSLTSLRELNLSANNITDISPLSSLTNLRELNLSANNITDISLLSGLPNLLDLDLRGNPYETLPKGDFDIELVLLDEFTESQKNVLQYVARRWMAVIVEDLPDYQFTEGWSGMCGGQAFEIPAGERIDDLRIYVKKERLSVGTLGFGGPIVVREATHLPVLGCIGLDLSHANLLITGLHEIGHVLGIGALWTELGYFQDSPDGDQHFNGPLAIAAFDAAGGRDYTEAKVPVEGGHWRGSVFGNELMTPTGAGALSAITVQSLADLGYGVDATQADAYSLPGAAAAHASATEAVSISAIRVNDYPSGRLASPAQTETAMWCGIDGKREPIHVVDQLGRIIRTIGN